MFRVFYFVSKYFLKEGLNVAIVDANRILNGITGHTTAKITSQHDLIYDKMINQIGMEKAKQYTESNEKAIKFIAQIVEEKNIERLNKENPLSNLYS